MIGEEDGPKYLQNYSNQVMNIFVNNQLFSPNGQYIIDAFIVEAGDILYSFIINNEIIISKLPTVQLLAPVLEHYEVF